MGTSGGFVDKDIESADDAIIREIEEETNLQVIKSKQFRLYSNPKRDPRGHTATMVYVIKAKGELKAKDDAKTCRVVPINELKSYKLAFDHKQIIKDYIKSKTKFDEN